MLTLKKVKEMVKAPVHTKRVPSPKVLLEDGRILLRKEFEHDSHLTLYAEKFRDDADKKLVGVYIDITGNKEIYKRPEMVHLLKDCKNGSINLIFSQTRAYFAANTCDFCFLLKYLFDLPMRVDIVTDDDDQRIDTILDVDNQRQSLKDLAEKYTSIRRKDYLEWRIRLEHEMTKAEKNERGRTV